MAYEATPARTGAIAAARDSEAFRAALRVLVSTRGCGARRGDLRRPFLRSCERRAGGGRTQRSSTIRRSRTGWPSRSSLRSPAGTPSGTCESPTRATARALPGPPSSRCTRCWCAPLPPRLGSRSGALLVAAYAVSLAAFLAALVLLYRLTELELGAEAGAPNAAPACGVPSRPLLRRALFGEPLPAACGGGLLCGAYRQLGLGGGVRRARVRHAQRRPAAPDTAGDALVELAFPTAARRRVVPARPTGDRRLRGVAGTRGGRRPALSRRPGGVVARAEGAAGRCLGRLCGSSGRRRVSSGLAHARPCTSRSAAGDPFRIAAINVMLFATLIFAVVAWVGVWRRLPRAYGAWVGASLLLPLTFPRHAQPLMSLPRFVGRAVPALHVAGVAATSAATPIWLSPRLPSASASSPRSTRAGTGSHERSNQSRAARCSRHAGGASAAGPAPSAAAP